MIKRFVSVGLISALLFTGMAPVKAEDNLVQAIINKLLTYSSEDRENMILLAQGLVVTDSAVDAIAQQVENYTEGEDGIFFEYISPFFKYADRKTVALAIKSIKIIKPNIRNKYIQAFRNRNSLQLSDASGKHLQYFIQKAWDKYSGLERLMTEDKATVGVVGYMLQIFSDINDGKAILTDSPKNDFDFSVNTISRDLKQSINAVLADIGLGSVDEFIGEYIEMLNFKLSLEEKQMVKALGQEIGFYTPLKSVISDGFSSAPVYKDDGENQEITVSKLEDKIDVFEIALYKNGIKQDYADFEKSYLVKIPVEDASSMVYKLSDEDLEPIKYNVYSDNMIYMLADSAGLYAVKAQEDYFTDSDTWGKMYIESLYRRGIISGKGEGIFSPDDNITREEFVKLVVELFGFADTSTYYTNFSDVDKEQWYYPYIAIAFKHNIINGIGENRFGVGENISRQDICKIIDNITKAININAKPVGEDAVFIDSGEIDDYALSSVNDMYKYGIISGSSDGRFYPKNYATRQEAAKIIYHVLELYIKSY
jgi:hypothetical protein